MKLCRACLQFKSVEVPMLPMLSGEGTKSFVFKEVTGIDIKNYSMKQPLICTSCYEELVTARALMDSFYVAEKTYFAIKRVQPIEDETRNADTGFHFCRACRAPESLENMPPSCDFRTASMIFTETGIDIFQDIGKHVIYVCNQCTLKLTAASEVATRIERYDEVYFESWFRPVEVKKKKVKHQSQVSKTVRIPKVSAEKLHIKKKSELNCKSEVQTALDPKKAQTKKKVSLAKKPEISGTLNQKNLTVVDSANKTKADDFAASKRNAAILAATKKKTHAALIAKKDEATMKREAQLAAEATKTPVQTALDPKKAQTKKKVSLAKKPEISGTLNQKNLTVVDSANKTKADDFAASKRNAAILAATKKKTHAALIAKKDEATMKREAPLAADPTKMPVGHALTAQVNFARNEKLQAPIKSETQVSSRNPVKKKKKNIKILSPMECPECFKVLSDKSRLNEHFKTYHKMTERFECSVLTCKYYTFHKLSLMKHIASEHEKPKTPKDLTYDCTVKSCRERFKTFKELSNHLARHIDVYPFACAMCDESFPRKINLDEHMKLVHYYSVRKSNYQTKA